jgi:hypothetical protein
VAETEAAGSACNQARKPAPDRKDKNVHARPAPLLLAFLGALDVPEDGHVEFGDSHPVELGDQPTGLRGEIQPPAGEFVAAEV